MGGRYAVAKKPARQTAPRGAGVTHIDKKTNYDKVTR